MKTYRSFIEDVDFVLENIDYADIQRGLAGLTAGSERRKLRRLRASEAQRSHADRSRNLFIGASRRQKSIRNKGW